MLPKSRIDKTYKVRDPIYGFIKLDAQEMDIINTPYFQRLRRIKQLSLTDMVYPGASHTRFEHSLGVMQMASDMFENIVRSKNNLERLVLDVQPAGLDRTKKIVRLAALLHDIGHAPFSHSGEELMPFIPTEHPKYKPNERKRYEHEDYGISIVKLLLRDLIEQHPLCDSLEIKAEDITTLLGDQSVPPSRISVIWKELISSQLDADRADYLLRDSLHIGVNYGVFDKNRLVNCVTIGESEEETSFLAIEEGGWHVAESLVIARYQMFSQVYFHPVRRSFDYHVGEAIKEVLKHTGNKESLFPEPKTKEDLIKYLDYDDWKIYGAFKNRKGGKHGEIILNREPFKCKKEWDCALNEEELSQAKEAINTYGGHIDTSAKTNWYKLEKDIKIFNEKSKKSYPLSVKSKLIKVMPELPKVTRLYINQSGEEVDL